MILSDLLKDVNVKKNAGVGGIKVGGISYDSRKVKPGDVFVCITGFEADGHKYARSAVESGAVAVVAEHDMPTVDVPCIVVKNTRMAMAQMAAAYYDYPFKKFNLIGITAVSYTHLDVYKRQP